MKVAVFGSANALEGDDLYDLAYQLGKLLAEAGHTVMTGAIAVRWKPHRAELQKPVGKQSV